MGSRPVYSALIALLLLLTRSFPSDFSLSILFDVNNYYNFSISPTFAVPEEPEAAVKRLIVK